MKVNRYKYGRTNVSMLESQRAGLVSPERMAAGTAAPYVAAADIAGEAADLFYAEQVRKNNLLDAEDELKQKLYLQSAKDQIDILRKKVVEDDSAPAEDFYNGVYEIMENLRGEKVNISERNQADYANMVDIVSEEIRKNALVDENVIREGKILGAGINAFNQAIQNNDPNTAAAIHGSLDSSNLINNETDIKMQSALEASRRQSEIAAVIEGATEVYKTKAGKDGVLEIRDKYLNDTSIDPETKVGILSGLNTLLGNVDAAEKKRIELKEAAFQFEAIEMIDGMSDPTTPMPDTTEFLYRMQADPDMNPKFAVGLYGKVVAAKRAAKADMDSFGSFMDQVSNGELIEGTTENQKNHDKLVMVRVSEQQKKAEAEGTEFGPEQQYQILIDTSKELGFTGFTVQAQLKAGLSSADGMTRMSRFFHDLTDDPTKRVALGLEDSEYNQYTDIEFDAMARGGSPEDFFAAAETHFQGRSDKEKDSSTAAYIATLWETEVEDEDYKPAITAWDDMWDSEPYDGWFRWGVTKPKEESPEFNDFLSYYYRGFENAIGDIDQRKGKAANYASKIFTAKNPPTNLNGKWEHQRDGIEGDAEWKRIEWWEANKDKTWFIPSDKPGKYTAGTLDDLKKLQFVQPTREPGRMLGRTGEIEYDVFYGPGQIIEFDPELTGGPLEDKAGRTVIFDAKDQAAIKSRMENKETIEAYEEELKDFKRDLRIETDMTKALNLRKAIERREKEINEMKNPDVPEF